MIEGRRFIARAEDPQTALTPVPLGARHELDAVSELSEARAADQCVTVRGEGEADFVADPMLVRRAVSHLLGHALKHTPPGGTVRRWRRGRCTKARWRSVVPIRGPASRRSTCRGFSTGFPGRQEQVGLLARFIGLAVLSWGELAPAGVNGKLFAESYRAPLLVWGWWWPAMVWRAVCPLEQGSTFGEKIVGAVGLPSRPLPHGLASGALMAGLDAMIQLLVAGVQLDREPAYTAWFLGKTASKETR